ncbi:MAG: DUF3168 domain-containing protein [Rhodothalassiaceae bacterium]
MMGTDALTPLLRGIRQTLRDNPALRRQIADAGAIMQSLCTPGPLARPGIRVARAQSRAWHSATFDGQEHELVLEVADRDARHSLCAPIIAALNDADIAIPGHALIDLLWQRTEADHADPAPVCRLWFKARTVSD